MSNPYDDIDFCTELLYDAVYKQDGTELYRLDDINRKEIRISDLKKEKDFDYSKVLSGKFKLHGYYNDRLHYTRIGNLYPTTMSIGFCNKKINLNDPIRPELYHMAMLYMSTELVFDEKFNHTLLPIMCFDIKKQDLLKYLPNVEKDFGDNFQKDVDDMYVIITEHYSKIMTLQEFLDVNKDTVTLEQVKSILFQIYVTLMKLSERFNKFRHNKLNLNAILIFPKEKKDDKYKISGETYIIKDNDIEIKFTDFDYSYHIGDYVRNDNKIIKYEGGNIENPYYDIHYITNLILLYFEANKQNENIYKILKKCGDFFMEIIPEKYKINTLENYKGLNQELFNKSEEDIITPLKIIKKNIFFKNFIMENIRENIESLNIKGAGIKYIESSFLNNFENKKSNQYYRNMLKGSRQILSLESLTESSVSTNVKSDNTRSSRSSKSTKSKLSSSVSSASASVLSGGAKKKSDLTSSTSFTFTESNQSKEDTESVATIVNPELTSVTQSTNTQSAMSGGKKTNKKVQKKSSKKDKKMKGGQTESSSSSSTSDGKSSSSKSSSSSSSSSSESDAKQKRNQEAGQNLEYINYLKPEVRNKLKKLPEGYMDLAPENMLQNMPNLDQNMGANAMSDMGMPADMQGMGMPAGMPGMGMGMNMPNMGMGMPQMPPNMMAAPPMPAEMQKIAMGASMGQMNPQLQTPMMANPMSQFMGMQPQMPQMGGSKKMKKYKLVLDKNFFF